MTLTIQDRAQGDQIEVRVASVIEAAVGTRLFELEPLGNIALPAPDAGSHIDVHLPNGIVRQYSLVIGQAGSPAYTIAVKKERVSSGGSRFLHNDVSVGQRLQIGRPRDNFQLNEAASHTVLIADGIGITPIWSMLNRVITKNLSYHLYYAGRSREEMVFIDELQSFRNVHLHVDRDQKGFLDIVQIRLAAPAESHFYCCGTIPLLEAFNAATKGLPEDRIHREYFTSSTPAATEGGFTIELFRSKRILFVKPGQRIIDVLLAAGVSVLMSCEKGICGTCETKVISGIPDHRDDILAERERSEGKTMMVCCSGAVSDRLVLDLQH